MLRSFVFVWTVSAALLCQRAVAADSLFPFVLSYDSPTNVTSVADWLDKPAGQHGFVKVDQGRLTTSRGPLRLRSSCRELLCTAAALRRLWRSGVRRLPT